MKFISTLALLTAVTSAGFLDSLKSGAKDLVTRNYGGYYGGNHGGNYGGNYGGYHGGNYNQWGCTEGTMFCDYQSGGFYTCAQGRYVLRQCGPGTRCQQQGQNNVFCNYA